MEKKEPSEAKGPRKATSTPQRATSTAEAAKPSRLDRPRATATRSSPLPPPQRVAGKSPTMSAAAASATNVAVIGGGISGAVCASLLAARGVAVTLFDSGRGAGGRMAQRREVMEDGTELRFDHGAPYFTVSNDEVARIVSGWEARGLVAEWKAMFACFDRQAGKFTDFKKEETTKKYVGVPGMNSICKSLCLEDGVVAKFGVTIGRMDWIQDKSSWSLSSLDGKDLGHFDYVVATDKNIASPRFAGLTGRPPPLVASQDVPVYRLTAEYASKVINNIGPRKPSADALAKVAEELFKEFQATGLNIPQPIFMKAHRWGGAFPATAIGGDDRCVWDKSVKLAICGDFCASPSVEGAVLSGMRGASKIFGRSHSQFADTVSSTFSESFTQGPN
uniref:Amine oxidase domain-containing protein n=1 Tax=Leersia perrieri TaxID=77586 RepID=A0A0D9VZT7_9ORYZ